MSLVELHKKYKPEVLLNLKGRTCLLSDRFYVPNEFVDDEMIEAYTHDLGVVEIERDEYGDEVEVEKSINNYKTYPNVTAFHRGDLKKLSKVFDRKLAEAGAKVLDIRAKPKMSNDIQFVGELYKDQKRVVSEYLEYGYGIIKCQPRYGKTVCLCAVLCGLKRRTIVIVHQKELVKQFVKALKTFTDAFDYDTGVSVVTSKNIKDLGTHDICIVTWQLLNAKNGKKALRKYRNAFGLTIVDEAHRSPSPCFKRVVSAFNAKYRCGCTATDKRKDMMECIVYDTLGPVVTRGKMKKVLIDVHIEKTNFNPKLQGNFMWHTLEKRLGSSKARNEQICNDIKRDMESSKFNYGLVVTRPVFHVELLVKKLRKMGINAVGFWGASPNRDKLLEDMVQGKYKVVVANRSMLLGINVPRWSHIYITMPSSNAPNLYQEISRIRTPNTLQYKNKEGEIKTKQKDIAYAYYYLDDFGPCYGCYTTIKKKVFDKDSKMRVIFGSSSKEKEDTCGGCKYFSKCVSQGKEIRIGTHACQKFAATLKRRSV